MSKIVGIDLGTTNSVVAVMEGGEPTVISTAEGGRLCPSVVGFTKSGERLVGQLAKRQAITNPDRTIISIKRKIGTDYTVKIDEKDYSAPEISAMVLQKLKADAEAYLGEKVTKAVITVPAYFSDSQRQATKDAGSIAGLEVVRIINEPTAASLAYGVDKEDIHTILVWDLGGGTFDVSILEVGEGVFEVKSTAGDTSLGGDDWDERIVNWLADGFKSTHSIDLRKDKMALQRLREAAEKAKVELSNVVTTSINLPFISVSSDGPVHMDTDLTRAKFEELTYDLLQRMIGPTRQSITDAKLEISEIDKVLLVGGSTRMPAVQELVRTMFSKEPHRGLNPDEVVAAGAAIQGGILAGEVKDIVLLDVAPLSLGIETLGGVMAKIIERNTTIPTSKTQEFTTAADNQCEVEIKVYQGEREFVSHNKFLGDFHLSGILAAPRGVPRIEVEFEVDANGIVNVSAKDKASGKAQSITITGTKGLKKEEIDSMVRDAEAYAEEDRKLKEEKETRNFADSVVYSAEKAVKDADGKVPAEMIEAVQADITEVRSALSGEDIEAIRKSTETLSEKAYELAAAIQRAESPEEPAPEQEPVAEAVGEESSSEI